MDTTKIEYINLEELSNSNYKIDDGQADITGWPVVDESGRSVGSVRDLLFEPAQEAIRYVIVDLDKSITIEPEKAILIPIGYVNLAENNKEVVVPVMSEQQYLAMPRYIIGEVTRNTEMEIRSAIGSPAALRIEEEIAEMDHSEFYKHHHFDRGNIISSKGLGTDVPAGREAEQNKIHHLIKNAADENAPEIKNTNEAVHAHEDFSITLENKIFRIETQQNGIYRIFEGEAKLGAIYAQTSDNGVEWATMDELDEDFVTRLGTAITDHNLK